MTLVTIYGQTRILYAVSCDGLVSPAFKAVDARTHTPVVNTVIVSVVVGLVAALVDSTYLWDMVSMGTLTAFIVVSIAVPVIRRRQRDVAVQGFRVPFGPYVVPALSVLACLLIMKDLSRTTFEVFAIWMVGAVLAYGLYGVRHSRLNG